MERGGGILEFYTLKPWVFAGRLIKMAMNTKESFHDISRIHWLLVRLHEASVDEL
jgi:hypothetical protein